MRVALGMNEEGIDVTESESVFSLSKLGLSKNNVDDLENAVPENGSEDENPTEDNTDCDEDEYDELLDTQMDSMYDQFLSRRGDASKTANMKKRTKIAKRALAGEALTQDSAMYDGDIDTYQTMINPEEVSTRSNLCLTESPFSVVCFENFPYSIQLSKMGKIERKQGCLTGSCFTSAPCPLVFQHRIPVILFHRF